MENEVNAATTRLVQSYKADVAYWKKEANFFRGQAHTLKTLVGVLTALVIMLSVTLLGVLNG